MSEGTGSDGGGVLGNGFFGGRRRNMMENGGDRKIWNQGKRQKKKNTA